MRRQPLVLATLLPALLDGCSWGCEADTYMVDTTWTESVDEAAIAEALDAFGELTPEACDELCGAPWVIEMYSCERPPVDTGDEVFVSCFGRVIETEDPQCDGRAHATRLPRGAVPSSDPVRARLARSAWEEAASVGAFRRLARELAAHGAPATLVERARANARDEIRHARALRRLAGAIERPRFAPECMRSLREIGLENAVEGCVRETYAALIGLHQARAAAPPLRPVFGRIAADEVRHGQWSWDLDAWLRTRLPPAELDAARASATVALVGAIREPEPSVRSILGLPPASVARRLARGLVAAMTQADDPRFSSSRSSRAPRAARADPGGCAGRPRRRPPS